VRTSLSSRLGRRIAIALIICSSVPPFAFALASGVLGLSIARGLLVALIAGSGCTAVAAMRLGRRYLPALRALERGIASLQQGHFGLPAVRASDELGDLTEALARSASSLQRQFRAIETLAEVDRLLLGSAGLEQVLDAILSRVQGVARCHGAGIALRDADAPGHGRVYAATAGCNTLPVWRVALDDGMLARLAAETQGLTIARSEDARHSFLKPLKDTGAEFFWVWPVIVGERVEAILAIGYASVPVADPLVTRCGGEFAARLAIALANSAREERLYRQAHYDPLTGLPNRLLFRDRLSRELGGASPGKARGALLYIDLDHFKRVNDGFGHGAGDQLLTTIAQRLRACVKDGDTVARLGGDEFAIVLANVTRAEAEGVARRVVESLALPVSIGGHELRVSASLGVALIESGAALEELVGHADAALYRAKELGRARFAFFDLAESGAPAAPVSDTGLQRALRKREFSLFYQPQFEIADGSLAAVEALLRWQTPREGLREPDAFVPAAEESGLILDIGGWVLEAACAQLAAWRAQGIGPPRLALNICAAQLEDADLPKAIRRVLDRFALPAELIELELTADALSAEPAQATVARLAQSGVRLALDDVSAGEAVLDCLRDYPIGTIKLDRALIGRLPEDAECAMTVGATIAAAHALGRRVVAKGIERIEQLDFLRERHCDLAQGFYLARPLSVAAVAELLAARGSAAPPGAEARAAG